MDETQGQQGLGQMAAAPVVDNKAQPQQGNDEMLQQVVQLLMQGIKPSELIAKGVPEEVVRQAIEIIKAQMANQQGQQAPQAGGQPMSQQGQAPQGLGGMMAQGQ